MISEEDILRRLLGPTIDKENPLEAIGLSPAILTLGLTPDDLYEHCRRIARDLLARVHPDRHQGIESPLVGKFSKAFNLLNDRAEFDVALSRLRSKDWKLRRENVDLRNDRKVLLTRIRNLEEEVEFLTAELNKKRQGATGR